MPELPEVETIVRRLAPLLVGTQIERVDVRRDKSWSGDAELILNRPIVSISRRAKYIITQFAQTDWRLVTHLKMTGQLIYVAPDATRVGGGHPTADWVQQLPSTHTRIQFALNDGSSLFFNDQRVFGWCRVMPASNVDTLFAHVGPDIIDARVTDEWFAQQLRHRSISIKQAIMDHTLVAGVGNIYACDGLHLAGVSPTRACRSLSQAEFTNVLHAVRTVVQQGIELEGATISDYTTVDGFAGGYQDVRRVYKREGEPCLVCSTPIIRIKQGGRSTFLCPSCQQ